MKSLKQTARNILNYKRNKKRAKSEYKEVHRMLTAFPKPELTQTDIQEIDSFWSRYGVKFTDYSWFQWYYGVTGIHDPRFIGNDVYHEILFPHHNMKDYICAWREKSYFYSFLPEAPFPKMYIKKCNGRYYDQSGNYCVPDDLEQFLHDNIDRKEFIVKFSQSYQGRGVFKYSFDNKDDITDAISKMNDSNGFVIQEVVSQHPFFAQFNKSSVNIIRIYTLFLNGEVIILDNATLRFGIPGSITDVNYRNGKEIVNSIGITKDGRIIPTVYDIHGNKTDADAMFHIEINQVPSWDDLLRELRKSASRMPYFAWIGWDVTVSDSGKPVIIEYNILDPGIIIYQHRGPLFGEHTEAVLSFLEDKANQEKSVPFYLKTSKKWIWK